MQKFLGLRGTKLNYAVGIIAGVDFLLFGYDQGVVGGLLTEDVFLSQFPDIWSTAPNIPYPLQQTRSTNQGISVASYNLGCFFGAIATMFLGNPLGRKKVIMLGTSIMVVGAALQCSSFQLPQLIVGRIITGFGNGLNTSTIPMWQSEISKAHHRGALVMVEGALITGGVAISYWFDYGMSFVGGSVAWRLPIAFQIAFCLVILTFVPAMPESPRWLILRGKNDEALEVLAALADTSTEDKRVLNEFDAIKDTVIEASESTYKNLFDMGPDREFHRVVLGYVSQVFQQISGINLITYYAATLFRQIGLSANLSRLLAACNGTEYFLASWIAVFLIERSGRRNLMLFGSVGQAATMVILAITNSFPAANQSAAIAAVVFLFVFNTFFAIGWLGMTWLYPAEIVPLRIRAPANAIATSANWIFNFLIVMITPISFTSIGYQTYIIFAVINAAIVPAVYFFYPETAYRSLEEMDSIFQKAGPGWKGVIKAVSLSKSEPFRYSKKGELLIDYDDTDAAQFANERRRSSLSRINSLHVNGVVEDKEKS